MPDQPPPRAPAPAGPGDAPGAPCAALAVVVDGDAGDPARLATLVPWVRDLVAAGGATCLRCDVAGLAGAELGAIDALARVALVARRAGVRACVHRSSPELAELIGLAGLAGVLPPCRSGGDGLPPAVTPCEAAGEAAGEG